MPILEEIIQNANTELLSEIMNMVMKRYETLFPQWQMNVLAIEKGDHYNEQIDRTISLLEYMRTSSRDRDCLKGVLCRSPMLDICR